MGADRYFSDLEDAITAYTQGVVDLHASVWVRFEGEVLGGEPEELDPSRGETAADGSVTKFYIGQKTGNLLRRCRVDKEGNLISQYIRTTPGRIIFNKTVQDALV